MNQKIVTDKKKNFICNNGIYCFADSIPLCKKLLDGGARIIQLRNKHLHDRAFYQLAEEIVLMVRRYDDAVLIINDRVDIALKVKADGIHIGQEDENYREVIRRAPKTMIVGVSVDTVNEAIEAEQAGATYIGAGSIFPRPSKSDAKLIGIEIPKQIVKSVSIPVVAIGGIGMRNIHQVMETGARYYAMISEINNAKNIPGRLRELFSIVKKGETRWN